jgi:hypothetical protein
LKADRGFVYMDAPATDDEIVFGNFEIEFGLN